MNLSLDYYTKHFGPYQFRQLRRILALPDLQGSFAQSFANTVPFSEDFVLQDLRKPTDIDYITYVTAHETAHQWWATRRPVRTCAARASSANHWRNTRH